MEKDLKITPPEGYEIDRENSTFEHIKFKPINMTYEDIAKYLFKNKPGFATDNCGKVYTIPNIDYHHYADSNNATSEKQLEKLLAINKLMNVAKYLNGNWKPNWDDSLSKWLIYIRDGKIDTCPTISTCSDTAYFKLRSLAQQAIDILGEDTIRLALSTNW